MAAIEKLCHLLGGNPKYLSYEENLLLEADLFTQICHTLETLYKTEINQFSVNTKAGKTIFMLETQLLSFVINDILRTEDYSLTGIAYQTQIPEEVIYDILIGKNHSPSLDTSRRIIDLHRSVRPELYRAVIRKVLESNPVYKTDT